MTLPGAGRANAGEMPLGRPSPAPAGYLELCNRAPQECAEPGVSASDVRIRSRQQFWYAVFDRPSGTPASTHQPAFDPAQKALRGPSGFGRREGTVPPPYSSSARAGMPDRDAGPTDAQVRLSLTAADRQRIDALNRHFNRYIRRASDQRQYGVDDYWATPTDLSPSGDCEDYVLAKRRGLIDLGYDPKAFSIALVVTPWGEDHAVLLMSTTTGEVVLDNLSQGIVGWDQTNYRWVKRQVPGRSLEWVQIG